MEQAVKATEAAVIPVTVTQVLLSTKKGQPWHHRNSTFKIIRECSEYLSYDICHIRSFREFLKHEEERSICPYSYHPSLTLTWYLSSRNLWPHADTGLPPDPLQRLTRTESKSRCLSPPDLSHLTMPSLYPDPSLHV